MSYRGRGTLEISRSTNPFYSTTNSAIGLQPTENVQWSAVPEEVRAQRALDEEQARKHNDLTFLYTRQSDQIGQGVSGQLSGIGVVLNSAKTKAQIIREKAAAVRRIQIAEAEEKTEKYYPIDVPRVLEVFEHKPKVEDPRYTTSSNEIGKKKPTAATFVKVRMARNQAFSNSFNGIKPKNTALNTSITRSQVHEKLDQTFL